MSTVRDSQILFIRAKGKALISVANKLKCHLSARQTIFVGTTRAGGPGTDNGLDSQLQRKEESLPPGPIIFRPPGWRRDLWVFGVVCKSSLRTRRRSTLSSYRAIVVRRKKKGSHPTSSVSEDLNVTRVGFISFAIRLHDDEMLVYMWQTAR